MIATPRTQNLLNIQDLRKELDGRISAPASWMMQFISHAREMERDSHRLEAVAREARIIIWRMDSDLPPLKNDFSDYDLRVWCDDVIERRERERQQKAT